MPNPMGKTRPNNNPYLTFKAGDWTWNVLKANTTKATKQYASWLCYVTSPMTGSCGDTGDTYVQDVVGHANLVYADPTIFPTREAIVEAITTGLLPPMSIAWPLVVAALETVPA